MNTEKVERREPMRHRGHQPKPSPPKSPPPPPPNVGSSVSRPQNSNKRK